MPQRGFVAYVATATSSRSATDATPPAILLASISLGASASTGPILIAFLAGAAAIGGPVVGAFMDRTQLPRRAFAIAMLSMAAALAMLNVTLGHAPLLLLALITLIAGFSQPAISGAWTAQLPRLVPDAFLRTAYAIDAGTYSIAAIIGPPAAAAVLVLGPTFPLLVPIALLVVAAALITRVPLHRQVHARPDRSLLGELLAGCRALWELPALRRSTVIGTFAFGGQAAFIIVAPMVSTRLTGELAFTGFILGAYAVGGVAFALVFAKWPVRQPDRMLAITTLVAGVALAGVGAFTQPWLVLLAAFVMGATDAPLLASMFQIRTREAPTELRAQVFTTSASLRYTAFALVAAGLGAVIWLGPLWIALIGCAIHLLGVAAGRLSSG